MEVKVQNFSEKDWISPQERQKIGEHIESKQTENQPEKISEHQAVKEYLKEAQPIAQTASSADISDFNLPDYLKKETEELKKEINKLLNIAQEKGINHAISEAQKNGPFFVDAFHDALAGKIIEKLKK